MRPNHPLGFQDTHAFLEGLFGGDPHAKRVPSPSNATLGVIRGGPLAIHAIGQGLALARGPSPKHAIKQADRLPSNPGIGLDGALNHWVGFVVGARTSLTVAMDWTGFAADGQATLMLSLLTRHGRATPSMWLSVDAARLKNQRNGHEYRILVRLAEALASDVEVCVVADRGFGDRKPYAVLTGELHFDCVIRFRGNIAVTAAGGETRPAAGWAGPNGHPRVLPGARVTAARHRVGAVVCVRDKAMKQAWCPATSIDGATARSLIKPYGKRWGIESGLRDTKDLRFGMGLGAIHVGAPDRRDRLLLLNALAVALPTPPGAAGEALGHDRALKSNTTKRRTHSLFRQGCLLYDLIPTMPEARLRPLIECFDALLAEQPVFAHVFGPI